MKTLAKSGVRFDREAHTYTAADGRQYKGVTPIVSWVYPHTYDHIPEEVLNRAAEYGSMVHASIEALDVAGLTSGEQYVTDYATIKDVYGLRTVANEYLVDDGQAIASSIDLVMEREGGDGVLLADIKTTSKIHDDNVTLQLSIYAWLFERMNPDIKVVDLAVVWLPKPQYGQAEFRLLTRIPSEEIERLVADYLAGADPTPWQERFTGLAPVGAQLPVDMEKAEREIVMLERQLKDLKAKSDALKDGLTEIFAQHGVKKWTGNKLSITLKNGGTRKGFDYKRMIAEHPELAAMFAEYETETSYKESLLFTIKK